MLLLLSLQMYADKSMVPPSLQTCVEKVLDGSVAVALVHETIIVAPCFKFNVRSVSKPSTRLASTALYESPAGSTVEQAAS